MRLLRTTAGGLILAAGAAAVVASPLGEDLRLGLRAGLAGIAYRHDPVAPFCAAPCYAPSRAEGADARTGRSEALP